MKKFLTTVFFLSFFGVSNGQSYDHYFVEWELSGTEYTGVMAVSNYRNFAVLRLRYYSEQCDCYKLIEERYKMRWSYSMSRYYLDCTKLFDVYTGFRPPYYSPDNFYFQYDDWGNLRGYVLDDLGNYAEIEMTFLDFDTLGEVKPFYWPGR